MSNKLSKNDAMAAINKVNGILLKNNSTHFANINSSKSVWWFDISVKKIKSEDFNIPTFDFLIFNNKENQLHHLRVPTEYIRDNLDQFHIRNDDKKKSVSLELSSDKINLFQDIRPGSGRMPFAQFLVSTIIIGNEQQFTG
ncbi:MAG: hypothetical protein AB7S75_24970 [Desulfococcaceae bacterium]